MEKADDLMQEKEKKVKQALDPITNPKSQKSAFQKKL